VAAFGPDAAHYEAVESLAAALAQAASGDAAILVKGSRFMRMERVVQALCGDAGGAH
jgi:UDP-N-acetylmuramoyl-tripeptide--D-alanyl-D-alanine ligase